MFIEMLTIKETTTGKIVREIPFHMGANLVVDSDDSSPHNKVGKTTFLRLIDVALGAKDRKLLYTDADTGTINEGLRDYIVENKVSVELVLCIVWLQEEGKVHLKVDLFPSGHYYIDGTRCRQDDYWKHLNELLFNNEANIPKFRQLIHSFVRVSVTGDSDAFLRMLEQSTSNSDYRAIYNFLFDISDPAIDARRSELNKEKGKVEESARRYKSMNCVETVDEQRQIVQMLEFDFDEVKRKLDDIIDKDTYEQNRELIARVRKEYASLSARIANVGYRLERNAEVLEQAHRESERRVDTSLSQRFYDEVCSMVPDVSATFAQMVDFNNKLCSNRISYFSNRRDVLERELANLQSERRELLEHSGKFMSLVEGDLLDNYEELQKRLLSLGQKIGKRQEIIETLCRFDSEISHIDEELAQEGKSIDNRDGKARYAVKMEAFNRFFKAFAEEFNHESPMLVYYRDEKAKSGKTTFPVAICDTDGTSTGTRKSLIAAYDLAYQQFAQSQSLTRPGFVVHDVIENIEGDVLRKILLTVDGMNAQYIVAVLKEKLDSSYISEEDQERMRIIQLSKDNMPFSSLHSRQLHMMYEG